MKTVTAYQAEDGSLHSKKEKAARASILHLSKTTPATTRRLQIDELGAAFIVEHRKKVISLLEAIDAPEPEQG
ncbi:hypothetical protein [Roseibium sp.]|uniref:hypothetical protein n=1 Tax=Roseibium sp. TaxID=1936156 RepID=UPI003B521D51